MNQQTHYFFAVRIPNETKLLLKDHLEKLKANFQFSRWVHEQDLHITLAFLGNAPEEMLQKAIQNVETTVNSSKAFQLQFNKLGIFGNHEAPRIFWVDTIESEPLKEIRKKVFSASEEAGFQLEKRPFRPHITLARKWNGAVPFESSQLDIWNELQPEPLTFQAEEIILYQTHLNKIPKYEAKEVYKLE